MRGVARTPEADVPRNKRISVRVTDGEMQTADQQRGAASLADYIRGLIVADGKRQRLRRNK